MQGENKGLPGTGGKVLGEMQGMGRPSVGEQEGGLPGRGRCGGMRICVSWEQEVEIQLSISDALDIPSGGN